MLTVCVCVLIFIVIIVSIEYFCFMSVPFFYEQNIVITDPQFVLSEETSKHCIQVLRMKTGEQLNIADGKGNLFSSSIISTDKRSCTVKVDSTTFSKQEQRKVCIAISLIKNASRFEWFLEKATEMGVSEIIPLLCSRTERQHFRFDRMNNILIAAMLQSQQTWLPVLQTPASFKNTIEQSSFTQKLIAHCEEDKKTEIKDLQLMNDVQILIGPEGDFTADEIQSALQKNYQPVSLGNTRLRTETAGVAASALLLNL